MGLEIERKFLVDAEKWQPENEGTLMVQAYLGLAPNPTIRVRIKGDNAFLTIKGFSNSISRPEFEYEIPVEDAKQLMKMALSNPVEKIRHKIFHKNSLWEVDVFKGENEGLILAEIELNSEDETFEKPDWISDEVSSDVHYYNSYLSEYPFKEWK
mgnify:FL=1